MASVTRKRSFFIGLALTGFRPRIVSITKRAIWQANSTLPVWISVKNARRRVLADTGLPVCGLRMSWRDVLLRDPPSRQKLDQVAVIRGRDKSLPPGATRYARHFDHSYLKKIPSIGSSFGCF